MSSFMSILIMTIGALTIILAANTLIIASNPENLQITSLFAVGGEETGIVPLFANKLKQPTYIDVWRDKMILYPEETEVSPSQLEDSNTPFDQLLRKIEAVKHEEYIVLVLRPGSARFARKIREIIVSRGIDTGQELFELDEELEYKSAKVGDESPAPEGVEESTGEEATPAVEGEAVVPAAVEDGPPGPEAEPKGA
jgi:hypothetical protein